MFDDQPLSKSSPPGELLKTHYHIVIIYQYDEGHANYDELAHFIFERKSFRRGRGIVSWVSRKDI